MTLPLKLRPSSMLVFAAAGAYAAWAWLGDHGAVAHAQSRSTLGALASCAAYVGVPGRFGSELLAGMARVPGGEFEPGTRTGYPDEVPAGRVRVRPFWIDRTEVTNAQFARFVDATGYVTEAEEEGGAVVFRAPAKGSTYSDNSWWTFVKGASWRRPDGPSSDLRGRDNQPVVQITLADAQAYAAWLGRALPTEAEWEWAARAGGDPERLEREPRGAANYWQGHFPDVNTAEDGHLARAPVGCYSANGYGLHDMIGNVWEWTADAYRGARQPHGSGDPSAARAAPNDGNAPMQVIKGGSFLCAPDYCVRYRAAARHPQERSLGVAHVGFRTVLRER
jgi:formylglycine-generating enzyme